MRYALIDKKKGEEYGILPIFHVCFSDKMVVNENELRIIDDNIETAARLLEGEIMEYNEIKSKV